MTGIMRTIKNIRLEHYDYSSDGYYFVTVCTDYLKPYLVDPVKSVVAQIIEQTFERQSLINQATTKTHELINQATTKQCSCPIYGARQKYIPGVRLDWHIIMPTHIHLILILENCNLKLGEIIRRFKAKSSKAAGFKLWQPNYYEHVIRNEDALNKIREYIQNNPQAREIKFEEFYTDEPDKSGDYKDT